MIVYVLPFILWYFTDKTRARQIAEPCLFDKSLTLVPIINSRINRNLYLLLVGGSVEGQVNVVDVARAEAERVFQQIGDAAHCELDERGALLYVLGLKSSSLRSQLWAEGWRVQGILCFLASVSFFSSG